MTRTRVPQRAIDTLLAAKRRTFRVPHHLALLVLLVASWIFSTIWSVTLYSLLSSTALSTAWNAKSVADVAKVPMVSLMPMSSSSDFTAPDIPENTSETELTAPLESELEAAPSMAPEMALPNLSGTVYLSLIMAPKLRTSRPPVAMPLSAWDTSLSSFLARYDVAAKTTPPTQTPPRRSPASPPRTPAVVTLLSSVTFTNATDWPPAAGAAAPSARSCRRLREAPAAAPKANGRPRCDSKPERARQANTAPTESAPRRAWPLRPRALCDRMRCMCN
mmetsp:Transcript_48804/g.98407  ORF Transcript_48804/g.98407 Transcript_48804/m.98407 type:complete len:277 (+) Transcript_48804:132-962(+)